MISGRGLGHTGGTLDKLEAIPGLRTQFDKPHLDAILSTAGCVIAGATGDIAPQIADYTRCGMLRELWIVWI